MPLKTFRGGVHPPDCKRFGKNAAVVDAPAPELCAVPLSQHIGKPATPTVKAKDAVRLGQIVGEADGFISAAVHAPVSGTVRKIDRVNLPNGAVSDAVLIENDGEDAPVEGVGEERDTDGLDATAVRKAVQDAGVVGLGGATFPTHVKLSPPDENPIDTVVLNGVECEPYLTADERLMLESAETVVEGMLLIMRAVGCDDGVVGIEANKPEAAKVMEAACAARSGPDARLRVELLAMSYPQGAEKQLISACLGREVPSGGLPMHVGVVVQNVGTAHAVYEACRYGRPLTRRIVTVVGDGVDDPANLRVRIGTPVRTLLEACGFRADRTRKLVFGGPMMGQAHFDLDLPVVKGMSGVLCLADPAAFDHGPCIRCGRCVDACPQRLMPQDLSVLIEAGHFGEAAETSLLDCVECGACTFICPARRPIVQWIKLAKLENRRRQDTRKD